MPIYKGNSGKFRITKAYDDFYKYDLMRTCEMQNFRNSSEKCIHIRIFSENYDREL